LFCAMAAAMVCEGGEVFCEPPAVQKEVVCHEVLADELEREVAETPAPSAESTKRESPRADGGDAESRSPEEAAPRRTPLPQTSYAAKSNASDQIAAASERAAAISAAVVKIFDKINRDMMDVPAVKVVAEVLGVRPMVVILGAMLSFLGFLLFGLGGQFVCMVVGCLYPAFESFKAIESADPKGMEFWLTYWVVYAAISCAEHIGYYILVWLPFYYPTKVGLLIWLVSPSRGGTRYAYRWFVLPFLLKNRDKIDQALNKSKEKMRSGVKRAVSGVAMGSVDTAKGAGVVVVQQLRRGLSMVRPGLGTVACVCLETATAAAMRSRAMSGDAAAAVFGARGKANDAAKDATFGADFSPEGPVDEPSPEPGDEPAAEPPASGEVQGDTTVAPSAVLMSAPMEPVVEEREAETTATGSVTEPSLMKETARDSELVMGEAEVAADAGGATELAAAVESTPMSPGRGSSESSSRAGGFFGEIHIPSDTCGSDME